MVARYNTAHTMDIDFEKKLNTTDEVFLKIEALDDASLDIGMRRRHYHHEDKEVTGEENANVGNGINPNNREGVMFEPIRKLNSYDMLYEKIKNEYGVKTADAAIDELWTKSLLLNDSDGSDQRYCVAMSAHFLVNKGRDYVTDVPNTNPKHYRSYFHTCIEQIMQMSNEFKGRQNCPLYQ